MSSSAAVDVCPLWPTAFLLFAHTRSSSFPAFCFFSIQHSGAEFSLSGLRRPKRATLDRVGHLCLGFLFFFFMFLLSSLCQIVWYLYYYQHMFSY
jgi:hypothetical protein